MLDFSLGELAIVTLVALIVVGPKELPKLMYSIGKWFGQFRGLADEFRHGFSQAMQDSGAKDIQTDLATIEEEIKYIRDDQGNLQRVYDISSFLEEKEKRKQAAASVSLPPITKDPT